MILVKHFAQFGFNNPDDMAQRQFNAIGHQWMKDRIATYEDPRDARVNRQLIHFLEARSKFLQTRVDCQEREILQLRRENRRLTSTCAVLIGGVIMVAVGLWWK